ncbi:ABC transporter substrate-binding protein [Streptomyces sp. TLI_146]|uniref:ABC transporter substrate-binding protein n=1 Tax=Streptomyces sp. TLI_146 TaxID=1938858 RepID=UPI000C70BB16|nr:ABC transporter substrate-binding protein [Streptomyces sp. TLI_146]PKV89849.1 iron complex transport system substrate-binding protein [Streptomyces sp. TLI_146]
MRPARLGIAALALALAAVGCGTTAGHTNSGDTADKKTEARKTTVRSCGRELSFHAAPQRAVALDQSSAEVLLALGLHQRMAGTSNLKTKIAPEYRDAYAQVPVLSPKILSSEQLRAAAPDLAVAGFTDYFTKDRVGTREELARLGLPSYVSAVDCPKHNQAGKSPFDLLFQDYTALGTVFGVQDRAARLVKEQRAVLDRAARTAGRVRGEPRIVWVYSVYGDTPYVAGRSAVPSEMSRLVGARNVFDDVDEDWPAVSWEQIASRNPDVIVVGDLSERGKPGDSAADKVKAMRADPLMSKLDAFTHQRVIEIPGTEMDPSVRAVSALPRLTAGMKELGYVR